MINFFKVLEDHDLKRCKEIILSLENDYISLDTTRFKTLGAASYLHYGHEHETNKRDKQQYDNIKDKCNPILMNNFKWLYDILIEHLSKNLNEPCEITPDIGLAYPGFHIFHAYENCEDVINPAHFDYQWEYHIENLTSIFDKVDKDKFLTFTLSIILPPSGAGLYYWPLKNPNKQYSFLEAEKEMHHVLESATNLFIKADEIDTFVTQKEYENTTSPVILDYKEGYITMFTQPILHQIMPFKEGWTKEDKRITLQGHGIKCDGIWRLYF